MSDEDLEILLTLDYPWYAPEDDVFHQLEPENTCPYWPSRQYPVTPISV